MDSRETINPRQFLALCFVALLSPIVRRMPRSMIMLSGGASWLAVLMAALPCVVIFLLLRSCLAGGRGLGELLEASVGKIPGRVLILLSCLWLCFYCGFLLHSAAHRLVSTVYADASPTVFILLTAALCLLAARGSFCALGRMAMLARPLLLSVLALLSIFALSSCRFRGVLPVTREDILPCAESAFTVTNTLSLAVYLGFAARRSTEAPRVRPFVLSCLGLLAVVELLTLGCLAIFGTELTEKLNYPFFMLVRDISIFDSLARVEALVVVLWIVTDFQLVSLLLRISSDELRRIFGVDVYAGDPRLRRLGTALCALSAAVALCIPRDILSLGRLSEQLVPASNALLIFALYPLCLLIGKLRGRI